MTKILFRFSFRVSFRLFRFTELIPLRSRHAGLNIHFGLRSFCFILMFDTACTLYYYT